MENILLNEYENKQKKDISYVKCDKCYKVNRSFNKKVYICNQCNINICYSCRLKHNKDHIVINYNDKNFLCRKHNDRFIDYCEECKENLCFFCYNGNNKHKNHNIIGLHYMAPNKEELLKQMQI